MAGRRKKRYNFYAVDKGRVSPMISQCWNTAVSSIDGYPGNHYEGFSTFHEARQFLEDSGHTTFYFDGGAADGPKVNDKLGRDRPFYAVSKGREPGIYRDYRDVKAQVDGYRGACHKSFATEEDAQAFVDGMMAALRL